MYAKKIFMLACIPASVLTSCGGDDGTIKDIEITTDTISSEVRVNFDLLRVNIPPPGTLTNKLSAAGISYNKSHLNPSGKAGSYTTNYQKAIGLGVYGADLGFAASYNQPQDALEYLGQMGKLAGDLGISNAFDHEFSQELIKNVGKPDTFQLMLDKAFDKAERNLRSNQRVAVSVLMVAGGWVEGLYLAVEGLNTNPKDPKAKDVYTDIHVHCHAFDYVFKLLEEYKGNPDCAKLLQEMEPSRTQLVAIGKNPKIGADELPKIRETVLNLRNKVVS